MWLKRGASASEPFGIRRACRGIFLWPRVQRRRRMTMAAVIIGVDPHEGSHTAVAVGGDEMPLD